MTDLEELKRFDWAAAIRKINSPMKKETVEDFLARGGKIITNQKQTILPVRITNNYSDKDFEKQLHEFYQSKPWKEIRESVKKDLTPMCPVCGSEENLVVDHIKPLRYFWEERLNLDNLQLLCDDCNLEKGSMLNWTLGWHIRNKKQLSSERVSISQSKKYEETRRNNLLENKQAFSGMVDFEKEALNSCYNSYMSRCRNTKIIPISKTKFRNHIESKMPKNVESPWFYCNHIKSYVKLNFRKIE